jgi:hypothetical protein
VETTIQSDQFFEIGFSDEQLQVYRAFADLVFQHVAKIESGAKYSDDVERLQAQLNDAYRSFMLEEFVPEPAVVVRTLLVGNFYIKRLNFPTARVRDFVKLLKTSTSEQRRIIVANLHTSCLTPSGGTLRWTRTMCLFEGIVSARFTLRAPRVQWRRGTTAREAVAQPRSSFKRVFDAIDT